MLVSRSVKRNVAVMAGLGAFLLVMHYLDVYWMVMPDAAPGGASVWLDLAAILFLTGVIALAWAARRAGEAPLPLGDSEIAASLRYRVE